MKDIVLVPGHRPSAPGAVASGLSEYPVVSALAEEIQARADTRHLVRIRRRPDVDAGLMNLIRDLNANEPDLVLSLHLNAARDSSPNKGYSVTWPRQAKPVRVLARHLSEIEIERPGNPVPIERAEARTRTDLAILHATTCPVLLDEPLYVDRADHRRAALRRFDSIAAQYASALERTLETLYG
jgi:N-acetylmuramoyl-L-alanine amidase